MYYNIAFLNIPLMFIFKTVFVRVNFEAIMFKWEYST